MEAENSRPDCTVERDYNLHRIQRSQLINTSLNHLLHLIQFRNVCDSGTSITALRFDLLHQFVNAGFVSCDIVDADIVAVLG